METINTDCKMIFQDWQTTTKTCFKMSNGRTNLHTVTNFKGIKTGWRTFKLKDDFSLKNVYTDIFSWLEMKNPGRSLAVELRDRSIFVTWEGEGGLDVFLWFSIIGSRFSIVLTFYSVSNDRSLSFSSENHVIPPKILLPLPLPPRSAINND